MGSAISCGEGVKPSSSPTNSVLPDRNVVVIVLVVDVRCNAAVFRHYLTLISTRPRRLIHQRLTACPIAVGIGNIRYTVILLSRHVVVLLRLWIIGLRQQRYSSVSYLLEQFSQCLFTVYRALIRSTKAIRN